MMPDLKTITGIPFWVLLAIFGPFLAGLSGLVLLVFCDRLKDWMKRGELVGKSWPGKLP